MSKFGAHVDDFTEREALMNHIFSTSAPILFISSQVAIDEVLRLVTRIRQLESKHRLLIVCYYDSLSQKQINELQAAGVDICQSTQHSHKAQAQAVKQWLD